MRILVLLSMPKHLPLYKSHIFDIIMWIEVCLPGHHDHSSKIIHFAIQCDGARVQKDPSCTTHDEIHILLSSFNGVH